MIGKIFEILTGRIRKETRVLLISSNIWYWGEGMFGPLIALFAEKIGGNILDISWAWAIYLIVTGLLSIVLGKISDKMISKKHLVILGYSINAIFTFTYLLIETPFHLFLVQAGLGLGAACAAPAWDALFSHYNRDNQSGYEWGLAGGQAHIYTALGILAGGLIVEYYGFNILFITMGSIQVIATLCQATILLYAKDEVNYSSAQ